MHVEQLSEERGSPYAIGILVGLLFWLTGCASLKGPQVEKGAAPPVDPFLQSGPSGTAQNDAQPPPSAAKGEAVAKSAVPAPRSPSTVTSAAIPNPKPGPTMTSGAAAARLLPPDTLSPGTATLMSGPRGQSVNEDKPAATLQPLQQAEWQSSSPGLTLEEANRKVQLLNPSAQKLERRNGKWHFSCELPKPGDPGVLKLYEADADKELDAVLAVLTQIERETPKP